MGGNAVAELSRSAAVWSPWGSRRLNGRAATRPVFRTTQRFAPSVAIELARGAVGPKRPVAVAQTVIAPFVVDLGLYE